MMSFHPLNPCLVRIFSETQEDLPVGAGFLASKKTTKGLIITCAHVIKTALNLQDSSNRPARNVFLDFPLIAPGKKVAARVIENGWKPAVDDVAYLELLEPPPDGNQPAKMISPGEQVTDHVFRAFGFPNGFPKGVWAEGTIQPAIANGWHQIQGEGVTGRRVEPGFSGTPVWDETLQGVIGMVVASDKEDKNKVAFIIPNYLLFEKCPLPDLVPVLAQPRLDKRFQGMCEALKAGELAIFLGIDVNRLGRSPEQTFQRGRELPDGHELGHDLARHFAYPYPSREDYVRVAQYVAVTRSPDALNGRLNDLFGVPYQAERFFLHNFLARLPEKLRQKGYSTVQLLITASYDTLLENAFSQANHRNGEPAEVVFFKETKKQIGKFWHQVGEAEPVEITRPNEYAALALDQRTTILNLHGMQQHSYVITEDQHLEYLASKSLLKLLPKDLLNQLQRRKFLFLGCNLSDWYSRALIRLILNERKENKPDQAWAIQEKEFSEEDESFWGQLGVKPIKPLTLSEFPGKLEEQIALLPRK